MVEGNPRAVSGHDPGGDVTVRGESHDIKCCECLAIETGGRKGGAN